MSIKSFDEVINELNKNIFIPLPYNAISGEDFDCWLHSIKNPIRKWIKRCENRDKLYNKLKSIGRKL